MGPTGQLRKFEEILAQYRRHGWRLARVLARPGTFAAPDAEAGASYEGAPVVESEADAMWFTRPSAEGREAWELRLVGDTPYALFELFEPDEEEEDREDVRREMEARLREYAGGR
ncbi:MAG: hypothetical protein ABW250_19935 [Pyrinomonadaceae bacterium]